MIASLHMIDRAHAPVSADTRKHMPFHQASSGRRAMLHMVRGMFMFMFMFMRSVA
jgi:hypothetical protein